MSVTRARARALTTVTVGYALFLYLFSPFNSLFLGWFVDFEDAISHRVHEITFGVIFGLVLVGVLAQTRAPERNVAGILAAILTVVVLTAVVAASTGWEAASLLYLIPLVAMVWLHPARREILTPKLEPSVLLLVVVVAGLLPSLLEFFGEFDKAVHEVRGHQSHWGGMATFFLVLPLVSLLAGLGVRGWPLAAWSSGVGAVVFGAASLAFPFDASGRPGVPGILMVAWGVTMVVAAERVRLRMAAELTHGGSRRRRLWAVPAALVVLLGGGILHFAARDLSPPTVPHSISSIQPSTCLQCHATGEGHAQVIDPIAHPNDEASPQFDGRPPMCADCHDLPLTTVDLSSGDVRLPDTNRFPKLPRSIGSGLAPAELTTLAGLLGDER